VAPPAIVAKVRAAVSDASRVWPGTDVLIVGPKSDSPAKTYDTITVAIVADVNVMAGSVTLTPKEKLPNVTEPGPVLVNVISRASADEGEFAPIP
jgi:thiamine biosynthesis protein ThiC